MNEKYDDPMLTAYALGELEGDDLAQIEAMLEKDAEARAAVDQIRASAAHLSSAFEAEAGALSALSLTESQRDALRDSAVESGGVRPVGRVVSMVQRGAVAAGLLAMVGVGGWAVLSQGDRDDGIVRVGDEAAILRDSGVEFRGLGQGEAGKAAADLDLHRRADRSAVVAFERSAVQKDNAGQLAARVTLGAEMLEAKRQQQKLGSSLNNLTITPNAAPQAKPNPTIATLTPPNSGYQLGFPGTSTRPADAKVKKVGRIMDHATPKADPADAAVFYLGRKAETKAKTKTRGAVFGVPSTPGVQGGAGGTPTANPAAPNNTPNTPSTRRLYTDARNAPAKKRKNGMEIDQFTIEGLGEVHDRRASETVVADRLKSLREMRRRVNTEAYGHIVENAFDRVAQKPLSTFSIDVDTASYANVRRFLNQNMLPPKGALRIEECVNYFRYRYADPVDGHPFSTNVEVASCPWKHGHRLVRIGLKGREIPPAMRPASNFVFLIDVSGSMRAANKLGLVKQSMRMLVKQFDERDRVAIVVYAGASGLTLPSTPCNESAKILAALDRLNANGSTNGAAGIKLAYQVAVQNFVKGGNNRVILCTDGDFNVGVSSNSELVDLIGEKAKSGVFLSILGFGSGNLKDDKLEAISGRGNGNYHYIDSMKESRKVLGEQLAGTLITIAKDVKIQVEFNPRVVQSYRLLGYENRMLAARDFNDDTKDAGEIGAGHTVTALYEVVPVGLVETGAAKVDALKYQRPAVKLSPQAASGEMLTVKLRYKLPEAETSTKIEVPVRDHGTHIAGASQDFRFATAVAGFCMVLRESAHRGNASLAQVIELAETGLAGDESGRRKAFVELAKKAQQLTGQKKK